MRVGEVEVDDSSLAFVDRDRTVQKGREPFLSEVTIANQARSVIR